MLASVGLEGEPVEQQLRDRLDREEVFAVPDADLVAVDGHGGDGEPVGIDLGQLGDVGRRQPFGHRCKAAVELFAHRPEPRHSFFPVIEFAHGGRA